MGTSERVGAIIGTIIGLGTSVVETACAVIGILSFYYWGTDAFITCGIVILVSHIIQKIFINQSLLSSIIAAVIGIVCVRSILEGICIGLCFEAMIMGFCGIVTYIIAFIKTRKDNNNY